MLRIKNIEKGGMDYEIENIVNMYGNGFVFGRLWK
jgi:hypothetical protein